MAQTLQATVLLTFKVPQGSVVLLFSSHLQACKEQLKSAGNTSPLFGTATETVLKAEGEGNWTSRGLCGEQELGPQRKKNPKSLHCNVRCWEEG